MIAETGLVMEVLETVFRVVHFCLIYIRVSILKTKFVIIANFR